MAHSFRCSLFLLLRMPIKARAPTASRWDSIYFLLCRWMQRGLSDTPFAMKRWELFSKICKFTTVILSVFCKSDGFLAIFCSKQVPSQSPRYVCSCSVRRLKGSGRTSSGRTHNSEIKLNGYRKPIRILESSFPTLL